MAQSMSIAEPPAHHEHANFRFGSSADVTPPHLPTPDPTSADSTWGRPVEWPLMAAAGNRSAPASAPRLQADRLSSAASC